MVCCTHYTANRKKTDVGMAYEYIGRASVPFSARLISTN